MTLGLTFVDDTFRVRLALSGLPDGTVRIDHSAKAGFPAGHTRVVRGGTELEVVSGVATLDDWDRYVEGVANFYRAVPVDPPAGLLLTGTSGDYASTPDAAALDITGDIDLRIEVTLDDWQESGTQDLLAKYVSSGDQRSFRFRLGPSPVGGLRLSWSPDGTSAAVIDAIATELPTPDPTTGRLALRVTLDVDNGGGGWTATFYTAPSLDGAWAQLGDAVSGSGVTQVFAGSAPLEVGSNNVGTAGLWSGSVHAAEVLDGIDGTLVADPDFTDQPGGTTGFTDDAGLTWTVNGSAEIVGIQTASITPSHGGVIVLKSVRHPFLNRAVTVVDFTDPALGDRGGMSEVSGRSVPVSTPDQRASAVFEVELRTDTRTTARDMQLTLQANPHLFLHVPADCVVPGGHVRVGDVTPRRPTASARSDRRYWRLPCRLVAPPGPLVVAGTMTYAGLLNLYGGYDNTLAANSTYADLLDLMGEPEDLVTI